MATTRKALMGLETPDQGMVKAVNHPAAYIRVSTDEQAESGLGLASQLSKVKAMATVKDWPEPAIYSDEGVSGKIDIGKRPEGKRLLADIEAGKVDAVIIASLDRIGRKALFILTFVANTEGQIQLVSVREGIDTTTIVGRFLITIMAGIAEMDGEIISQRTKDALEERGREFGIKAGIAPYGYYYQGKEVGINDEQAEIVRRVFALRSNALPLRTIAKAIENEGTTIAFKTVQLILDREEVYRGSKRGESQETWPTILK